MSAIVKVYTTRIYKKDVSLEEWREILNAPEEVGWFFSSEDLFSDPDPWARRLDSKEETEETIPSFRDNLAWNHNLTLEDIF